MSSFEPLAAVKDSGHGFGPLGAVADAPRARGTGGAFRRLAEGDPDAAGPGDATASDSERDPSAHAVELAAAFARGREVGHAEAAERVAAEVAALQTAIGDIERSRVALVERCQAEVLELSLAVARKVVGEELANVPERWIGMIRDGVRRAVDRERIRIRVGPGLHAALAERLGELRAALDDVKDVELVEDPSFAVTACVVETAVGEIELGVDSQIAMLRAALEDSA